MHVAVHSMKQMGQKHAWANSTCSRCTVLSEFHYKAHCRCALITSTQTEHARTQAVRIRLCHTGCMPYIDRLFTVTDCKAQAEPPTVFQNPKADSAPARQADKQTCPREHNSPFLCHPQQMVESRHTQHPHMLSGSSPVDAAKHHAS